MNALLSRLRDGEEHELSCDSLMQHVPPDERKALRQQIDAAIHAKAGEILRCYFDSSLIGMILFSPEKGWLQFNDAYCRMLGYSRGEMEGLSWKDVTHADDLEQSVHLFNRVMAGEMDHYYQEKRYIRKDGSIIHVNTFIECVRKEDGRVDYFVGYVQDNSKQKAIEQQLRQSEVKFRGLLESAPDGMLIANADGRIELVNRQLEQLSGYRREELIGRPLEVLVPERFSNHRHQRQSYYASPHVRRMGAGLELVLRRKDGSEVPVEISLSPLQTDAGLIVSAAIRDNSARQQAEQALRESEARLKFAQEVSGVASWEWNMKSGDTTCSDNYPVLYGREAGDGPFNYQDWADTLHPDDRKQVLQAFTQAIKHPQQRFFQEYRVLWPDGSVHWIATRGGVVCDAQGQPAKMVGTDTEITGRKQAEQDRIRLEAQLFLAQKMQAIGQLTGGIAHDFNNILTGILGYCRLALRRCVDDDEGKLARYLREIQHGGERARDMIARMLAFSRTGPGDADPQPLPTLVESALGLLRPSLPASIDLHTHIADDLPPVRTDAGQFEQVLMNLCINARDAMDGNGGITIELYLSRLHWKECHSCHAVVSGEFVVLSVQDSGSGIPAEMQASIFDPFFSTKEVGQGTGLGLSMVHGIMHECGGHIRIHSTAAKGTTFYLLFPTGQGDAVQGPAAAAMEGPVLDDGRKQGVIMVIDDEVPVANYMRELLQEHGYRVVVQTDSSAALSIIQQAPDDVDLVITDQTMPGITGLELAREILLLRADMPVILTTGYSKQVDETIAKEAGIRAYIMKPIDDTALLDKVDGILAPQSRQDE